jgi:hypothetical protein
MSGPTLATPGAERSSLLSGKPSACGIGERNVAFALSCALLPREARVGGLRGAWWARPQPVTPEVPRGVWVVELGSVRAVISD